jgi:CheY-like chemotaxis protein
LCALFLFRQEIASVIESAKSRKVTVKLGENELTLQENSDQQRRAITDLQKNVIAHAPVSKAFVKPPRRIRSILWVDDNPRNNFYMVQQLRDWEVSIDLALTTEEGIGKFRRGRYDCVLSDLKRREHGLDNSEAGLELLRRIRDEDKETPFVIFCGQQGARARRQQALESGATGITASPTELYALLGFGRDEA